MTTCSECERPTLARGLCGTHYQRWRRANLDQIEDTGRRRPAIDRLLERCVEQDGCWVYQGATTRDGYAHVYVFGQGSRMGHRVAWEHFIGPIPPDLSFDHLCENPPCVNPWHGELVPIAINIARSTRGVSALNRGKTHCIRGHLLSGANVYYRPDGGRSCRACRRADSRAYRTRRRLAKFRETEVAEVS